MFALQVSSVDNSFHCCVFGTYKWIVFHMDWCIYACLLSILYVHIWIVFWCGSCIWTYFVLQSRCSYHFVGVELMEAVDLFHVCYIRFQIVVRNNLSNGITYLVVWFDLLEYIGSSGYTYIYIHILLHDIIIRWYI
jgi:hypothetical protein